MLLDQATDAQLQAARILVGATMVAFLGAPIFRHRAQRVRLVVVGLYLAGILGFVIYVLF